MTLKDTMNGPDWVLWIVAALFILISIIFLTGHGSRLIAGFNTMSKEEQARFHKKKLCRGMGVGFSIITVMIVIMALFENILPSYFAGIFGVVIVLDCIGMILYGNVSVKNEE